MVRARGADAILHAGFEATYADAESVVDWLKLPFVSSDLGEERPLLESDLLGQGREPFDPTQDVATDAGDVVVPVDVRNFGWWLTLLFGEPATTGTGPYTHLWETGESILPSATIEVGHTRVPDYQANVGVRGNTVTIGLSRQGLLNATIACIARGELAPAAVTAAVTPDSLAVTRFAQATGSIKRNNVVLGDVVSAQCAITNNLEPVETIRPDGRIEDADPAMVMGSGNIVIRFSDNVLATQAANGEPMDLTFGWTAPGGFALTFAYPRVFLPRVKRPVTGPAGVQATHNWQASGAGGYTARITLINDVATYAVPGA